MEQRADAPAAPQKPIDVTLGRVQQRADAPAPVAEPGDRRKREENLEAKKDADASKLMKENAVAAEKPRLALPARLPLLPRLRPLPLPLPLPPRHARQRSHPLRRCRKTRASPPCLLKSSRQIR